MRVSWKLNNGSETIQTAENSITYTGFTSDPGIRTIQMKGLFKPQLNGYNKHTPDSSLGGYDGLTAISFLTGSPYNWIITT